MKMLLSMILVVGCLDGGERPSPVFSSDPTERRCEVAAIATCANIGFPIAECWITLSQDCSPADADIAYRHCLEVDRLPPGSECRLVWR